MKKIIVCFICLFIIPFVYADWFYNSRSVTANIGISSVAEVVPTAPSGYVESAAINLTFIPQQTDSQELLKFSTTPQAEHTDNSLKFEWKRPEGRIGFKVDADIKTTNTITRINKKIHFPIEKLPQDVLIYTKPSETIDSNDEDIIRLASELVKGEDDLYSAVFKLADWTKNNINYNLSTLTADVSQKASWVLQYKEGVCDEMTSLFIALLRSVGVPAKFISGIAYTESKLFPEKWGAHGWADVYFPGYGWIPFDVTYGEFGWLDPTHIKFKESVDSDEPSTYYNWLGRNADLKTSKLEIKTNLIEKTGYSKIALNIEDLELLKKAVNFGSYNILTATIENPNDFYYATELYLNKPKEVKIIGNEINSILLLPNEKKKIFWVLKIDDNLDKRYSYTFPLVVSTLTNITSETNFASSIREKYASFEEIEPIAKTLAEEKEKKYSGNVELECNASRNEFYEYESAEVYCEAKNTGNIFLEDVDVCFEGKCAKSSLGISQTRNFTYEINKSKIGLRQSPVILKSELVSKASYVELRINDIPKIQIEDLVFPSNVSYTKNFTVSFALSKKSQSTPKNVDVTFSQNGAKKQLNTEELKEDNEFAVKLLGNQLHYGKNEYDIDVVYYDGLKKKYTEHKEFSINLTNVTVFQRLMLWFKSFNIQ